MHDTTSRAILIGYTNCGEKLCAAGGRISTQNGNALDIWDKSCDAQKNTALIQKVTASGHNSVVEHISFHLAFLNVSAVVEQFMIEFRLASFTVKSRRYVDFSDAGFYIPHTLSGSARAIYSAHIQSLFDDYAKLVELGVPKEDARFILPYCFFSNFYCSLNGRELERVLQAMLYGRGSLYPEIKQLGLEILEQVRPVAPGVFASFSDDRQHLQNDANLPAYTPQLTADQGTAEKTLLLYYTHQAEKCIAHSALLTEYQASASDIQAILSDKKALSSVITSVLKSARPRALENASFTFQLNGLSLSGITHLVRHRMQSVMISPLSQTSRTSYVLPESIRNNAEALPLYQAAFMRVQTFIQKQSELCNRLGAEQVYTLLSGNTLNVITTMNARELHLFLRLRTCRRAQWEIQEYAIQMLELLRNASPLLFRHFGPSCFVLGKCPEGRLSCGQMDAVQRQFSFEK